MSMPGAFNRDEPEIELPLTESEADEFAPSDEDAEDEEMTIDELEAAFQDDDDLDDEEDDDDDYEDDEGLQLEVDEDYDSDGNFLGDPELAEVERMASAADVATDAQEDTDEAPRYSFAIDPTTNNVFFIDGDGVRTEITDAVNSGPAAGEDGGTRRIMQTLRRIIAGSRGRTAATAAAPEEDDDDEEEERGYYGYRSGRRTAQGLFPVVERPVQEGVDLERNGLFGRPGVRYARRYGNYQRSINDSLRDREYRTAARPYQRKDIGDAVIPNSPGTEVAKYSNANVYCGQYSNDGSFFYTCAQDYKIRIYDMSTSNTNKSTLDDHQEAPQAGPRFRRFGTYDEDKTSLPLLKSIQAPDYLCNWTITDANLSPDNTRMIWSSISSVVGMAKVKEGGDDMDEDGSGSIALDFGSGAGRGNRRHFGIWSIRFSADGREIVAGAQSGDIYVYDLESRRPILSINAHQDDVNAVCFADTASSNVLVSGSDDNYLKVWDRRSLGDSGRHTRPSGHLVGHTEGITYVAPKGDGRFVLSNGKDQTCKLWDLRMMYSDSEYSKLDRLDVSVRAFDYRHGLYKKPRYMKHPHDRSLMTYTGHTVLRTLIRCHFSPEATTGQRYVYSGSYDGKIHIWNLDGTVAQVLDRSHTMPLMTRGASSNQIKMNDPSQPDRPLGTYPASGASPVVRDVSWAPYAPNIMSSAWTESGGSVAMHEWKGFGKRQERMT